MLDRRQSFRRRTLLGCRVSARKLGVVADGTVRDLSETGARVTLPLDALLPHTFDVAVSDGPPRRARLVWIRDGAAGLALAPDLVDGTPAAAPGQAVATTRATATTLATATTRAITMMDAAPATSLFEARLAAITARPSNQTR